MKITVEGSAEEITDLLKKNIRHQTINVMRDASEIALIANLADGTQYKFSLATEIIRKDEKSA